MSAWDDYLDRLPPEGRVHAVRWYDGRQEAVKELVRANPPGTVVMLPDGPAHVVDYTSGPGGVTYGLSYIDPAHDYRGAVASTFHVCAEHLTGAKIVR